MITLTDAAAGKVRELLASEGADDLALRVAVRPGGCSGFSYEMFFDGEFASDDQQATFGDAVKVVVDAQSAQLLDGATLDYKDGLEQSGFAITNPNASAHVRVRPVVLVTPQPRPHDPGVRDGHNQLMPSPSNRPRRRSPNPSCGCGR